MQKCRTHFEQDLAERIVTCAKKGQMERQHGAVTGIVKASAMVPKATGLPNRGDTVKAVIVKDPKDKDRPFAKHPAVDKPGIIMNPNDALSAPSIGDEVELTVAMISANGKDIQFRYPEEAEKPSTKQQNGKPSTWQKGRKK